MQSFETIRGWLLYYLSLGGRVIGPELAKALISAFLGAEYQGNKAGGERLARRVGKIHKIEEDAGR